MKAQRKGGRGQSGRARTSIVMAVLFMLGLGATVQADTVWLSGHHEIVDGDVYDEIWIYNDVTVDIFGGEINRLAAYDVTVTNWFGGQMLILWAREDSIVNIYGGTLGNLAASGDSLVYLYAYDVIYDPTGGYYNLGRIEGSYLSNDSYFGFDLAGSDTYSHIVIVSELVVGAEIDITPDTLNLASKGKWISCKMWLPEDCNVVDVEPNSIRLVAEPNDIYPDWLWFEEQGQIMMAKFDRAEIQGILEPGQVELTVTGELLDGTIFEGTDTIRVIDKGKGRNNLPGRAGRRVILKRKSTKD